jgi:hypothetical protein
VDRDDGRDDRRRRDSHKRQWSGQAEQAALAGNVVHLVIWRRGGSLHPGHQAQQQQHRQDSPAERRCRAGHD